MKLIIYHTNPLQFGGIDTFDYNFCKRLRDKFDITFLYKQGNLETIDRLKNLEIEVEKYDEDKKYICDICLCASAWGGYPDTVIAKTGRYIQMVHADYIRAKEIKDSGLAQVTKLRSKNGSSRSNKRSNSVAK